VIRTEETVGACWRSGAERAEQARAESRDAFAAPGFRPGVIRHIVLFRFAPATPLADVREVERRFRALREECLRDGRPYIRSIESGAQRSIEAAGDGFDLGFVVTFDSEGDRNYYVGRPVLASGFDPAHDAFKGFVGPLLDAAGALVFDFRAD
jgi:hypothetical protein